MSGRDFRGMVLDVNKTPPRFMKIGLDIDPRSADRKSNGERTRDPMIVNARATIPFPSMCVPWRGGQ